MPNVSEFEIIKKTPSVLSNRIREINTGCHSNRSPLINSVITPVYSHDPKSEVIEDKVQDCLKS